MLFYGVFINFGWLIDVDVDFGYYVWWFVLLVLGWVCELLELMLWLYFNLFDWYCLFWEIYVIEGFWDGCFVIYLKMYYVLVDGVFGFMLMC